MLARPTVISDRIAVHLVAGDPLSRAGIASELRNQHAVQLVDEDQGDAAGVALVVVEQMDEEAVRSIRAVKRQGIQRIVVVLTQVDDVGLLAAVEAGVTGLLRRTQATSHRLTDAILAASAGDGTLPADLLGRLLDQVGRLQRQVLNPRGLTFSGLTERELKVLKLLADGLDTAEVGRELYFSDRTVKNIVHEVTSRLNLRNRTHAVAYAIRQGLI